MAYLSAPLSSTGIVVYYHIENAIFSKFQSYVL